MIQKKNKVQNFLLDVDGVLTTGHFLYDTFGKQYKIFGPDDKDALLLLKNYIKIFFITSDLKGFKISKKRVEDMGFKIKYIPSQLRYDWVKKNFDLRQTIFMGDGLFDIRLVKDSYLSICPQNSISLIKKYADYVTKNKGGERAVAEACVYVLLKIFNTNIENLI